MPHRAIRHYIFRNCAIGALFFLLGCSSSNKPYTLAAQLPSGNQQTRVLTATIDVKSGTCTVHVVLLDTSKVWVPLCFVRTDHPNFKSFLIANQQVDFGAVGDGFQVLNNQLPALPEPSDTGSETGRGEHNKKDTELPKYPEASFPVQWSQSVYPGQVVLQGQNTGYMVTNATLTINESQGTLDVDYKTGYKPLHLECTVLANQHGDYNLIFNPIELNKAVPGANFNIHMVSEGPSISGNIWDSSGFDTWTPSLPPRWVAASASPASSG